MNSLVVVGSQWGDEGKGKIVNYLAEKADVIIRYQGGDNAGHTVKFNGKEFHLRTIPSGIFYEDKINLLGNGMVINPLSLVKEMDEIKKEGYTLSNLYISSQATLDLIYDIELDGLKEAKLSSKKIGTTKKGIGPSYTDKAERSSLRMSDLKDEDFLNILENKINEKNALIDFYGGNKINFEDYKEEYKKAREILLPHIVESVPFVAKLRKENKKMLFEGAQGTMLDIDFGTFPYVTSSNVIAGGAISGSGIGLGYIEGALGIIKAYTTRVGEGPFVTELFDETASKIREDAHEYGVNTHRARRIGWLDLVQLKYSQNVNGFKYGSLMLLDILKDLDEIKVCIKYELDGEEIDYLPTSLKELERCKPIYKTFPSFKEDVSKCKSFEELPIEAKNYIKFIEDFLEIEIVIISVGKDKSETIIRKEIF